MTDGDGYQDDAESERRDKIVATAAAELGPQDPDKYWAVVCQALMGNPHGISWCGGMALYVLRASGVCEWPGGAPWDWVVGKGFASRLPQTKHPLPGDIAYLPQPYQHHAIVERVDGDTVYTIDGNQSPGESVLRRVRHINAPFFYSIGPLVRRDLGEPDFLPDEPITRSDPPRKP
jgi:hypothetical protein